MVILVSQKARYRDRKGERYESCTCGQLKASPFKETSIGFSGYRRKSSGHDFFAIECALVRPVRTASSQ